MSKKAMNLYLCTTKEDVQAAVEWYKENSPSVLIKSRFLLYNDLFFSYSHKNGLDMHHTDPKVSSELRSVTSATLRGVDKNRDLAALVCSYYKGSLTKLSIDVSESLFIANNKIAQMIKSNFRTIRTPKTYFIPRHSEEALACVDLQFPVICKANDGKQGEMNFKASSHQELIESSTKIGSNILVQQMISNVGDYRLLYVGDSSHPLVFFKGTIEGSHISNTSQGSKTTPKQAQDIPEPVRDDCRLYLDANRIKMAGFDILQDHNDGTWYFLEVNTNPALRSGVYLEAKMKMFDDFLEVGGDV